MNHFINIICKERPVGTENNDEINTYLEEQLRSFKYGVKSLPFDCIRWESGASQLSTDNETFDLKPSPFSESYIGKCELVFADTIENLEHLDCKGKILILSGELTQTPLQPKDYPFYYPDEHKKLICMLEQKSPNVIVALTEHHPLCGLSPFPLFEDGNFKIPSAYAGSCILESMKKYSGQSVSISIVSSNHQQKSRQLIATKHGTDRSKKIVICAHMDTKYNTPGALDNAAGVAVLFEAARMLVPAKYSIDIVPFNGEEYFGACGELEYLQHLKDKDESISLLINIDSPCHIGANTAVSFYNLDDQKKNAAVKLFEKHPAVEEGQQWYAGDHCAFSFAGTPCAAITSSDLFDGGLSDTHTPNDTLNCIDTDLVLPVATYITSLVHAFEE